MKCWAAILGGCEGPQSKEHYLTKGLMSGPTLKLTGLPFCREGYWEVPLAGAASNILCKRHNELLSVADDEAIRLKEATQKAVRPLDLAKDAGLFRGPTTFSISGTLFSRWLCKTACNVLTVDKRTPPSDYIRHAFGQRTESELFFYMAVRVGLQLRLRPDRVQMIDFSDEEGCLVFYVRFFGLHWLATNTDLKKSTDLEFGGFGKVPARELMLRPKVMNVGGDLRHGLKFTKAVVQIDWSDSPSP